MVLRNVMFWDGNIHHNHMIPKVCLFSSVNLVEIHWHLHDHDRLLAILFENAIESRPININQINIYDDGFLKSFSRSFKYFCNNFEHFMIHLISDEVWLRARIHLKLKGIGAKCSYWLHQKALMRSWNIIFLKYCSSQ